jgi:hypothetical protein
MCKGREEQDKEFAKVGRNSKGTKNKTKDLLRGAAAECAQDTQSKGAAADCAQDTRRICKGQQLLGARGSNC